ncbi:MAG: ligase-associated DNA damage response endonuclease PdeM [Alphaproteobacteria bacterium]|nr:ligase-associated DNA damage response endonuclease PdeM [Alphaproteobacteria bacterium]
MSGKATALNLSLCGMELALDPAGALYVPAERTLVVSDLHLEKGSYFAARGQPLPPYDSLDTLARLEGALARHDVARVVSLGDGFHDAEAGVRMAPAVAGRLAGLLARVDCVWIAGNHDPAPPAFLGGRRVAEFGLGALALRHEPARGALGEVAGHLHPCAGLTLRGRRLRRRCFVADGERLLMPAFGAYAGGLDVGEPAIAELFGRGGFTAFLLGDAVYPIPSARLLAPGEAQPAWRLSGGLSG